jgi:HEPN domain-containing protein
VQPEGPADEARLEARRWLATAEEDLLGATAMLERDDVAPRLACFLAQQAAEKALKARLIGRGIAFPRIHDLLALRALLGTGAPAGLDDTALTELSAWAVEARYPGDLPDATAAEARRAVHGAGAILVAARGDVAVA